MGSSRATGAYIRVRVEAIAASRRGEPLVGEIGGGDRLVNRVTQVMAPTPPQPRIRLGRFELTRRMAALILIAVALVLIASGGVTAYAQYSHLKATGLDGVAHLKRAQAVLSPYLQRPGLPDATTLDKAASELTAAEHDFADMRGSLAGGEFAVAGVVPQAHSDVATAETLATAADEGCLAGLDLIHVAQTLQPMLHGALGSSTGNAASSGSATPTPTAQAAPRPGLTAAMLSDITAKVLDAQQRLNTTIVDLSGVENSALLAQMATPQQLAQLRTVISAWPRLHAEFAQADAWLEVAPALLGVNAPERILVELMDRGEMRATGGYIGDFGVATIQQGILQPFTLAPPAGYHAVWGKSPTPSVYPWWPYDYWVNNSNLSPDFPTAAQEGIRLLAKAGGPQTQGVVALTEPAIERVLAVVGPVAVPGYQTTVTAQNLETVIRQQTENAAVLHTRAHETFTGALGQAFQAKLHGLPTKEMTAIAQAMLTSMRTKDIQVYFSDPRTEALIAQLGFADGIAHGPGDALTIIDTNWGGSKANAFTTVTYTDTVTLDVHGTATHHLTITYDFNSWRYPVIRPYLGPDHYITYLRVYTPPQTRLISLDGFNGGKQDNHSDLPGRQMWGGNLYVPDGWLYTLHFAWTVPHAATSNSAGQWRYQLDVQHQPGSNQALRLVIKIPGSSVPAVTYNGQLEEDTTFTVAY